MSNINLENNNEGDENNNKSINMSVSENSSGEIFQQEAQSQSWSDMQAHSSFNTTFSVQIQDSFSDKDFFYWIETSLEPILSWDNLF